MLWMEALLPLQMSDVNILQEKKVNVSSLWTTNRATNKQCFVPGRESGSKVYVTGSFMNVIDGSIID